MSEELLAVVRQHYECIDTNDIDGLVRLYADDVTYYRPGYPPITGRAELARFYREDRVIRDGRHSLESVLAQAGGIALHGSFAGTLRDGREVAHRFAEFFVANSNGLLARRDTFFFAPLV